MGSVKPSEDDNSSVMLAWRVLVVTFLFLAAVLAGVAMLDEGEARDLQCPLLPSPEVMHSHGVVAKDGERCMYRDNRTWPACHNPILTGERENDAYRCVNQVCRQPLGGGGNCTDSFTGQPMDDWCDSDSVCEKDPNNAGYTCIGKHSLGDAAPCRSSSACDGSRYCLQPQGFCTPRRRLGFPCTVQDHLPTAAPDSLGDQCEQGTWCTRQTGGGELVCTSMQWGVKGTPCRHGNTTERPRCRGGQLFCGPSEVCTELIEEGGECTVRGGASDSENDAQCAFGLGCKAGSTPAAGSTVTGECVTLFSLGEGEECSFERFCKPGLLVESGFCVTRRGLDHPCSKDADCMSGLTCVCHGRKKASSPGRCQNPPLQLPAHDVGIPSKFVDGCKNEYGALARFLTQWQKKYDLDDSSEFDHRKEELETEALCCIKNKGIVGSHAWMLAGGYLFDLDEAGISCNSNTTWLFIVVCVTLASTVFGLCCLCCGALRKKPAAATVSAESVNAPFGDAYSPAPKVVVAQCDVASPASPCVLRADSSRALVAAAPAGPPAEL
eukprot:TRINITY_DN10555_c0_g3_i4.p1 TRINITY_DN10555_c0_g3~~TRINITY_DN10555_c0_g3_i4.p1  ORF type:complete len:582 (+),score=109.67 TRINITY_DN10555_c0_g3_i4:92-1747(+)